jgi:peroxiredoxin
MNKIGSIELPANYFLGWADDHDGGWRRTFKVSKAPATVILNRESKVVWQDTGPISLPRLKTAIEQNLVAGGVLSRQQSQLALRAGDRAPDFPFEYSKDRQMTLTNLHGRPVVVVFWASWSEPSLQELEYLQAIQKQFGKLVVLAVNDVDGKEEAEEVFKRRHLTLPLIVDKQRQIAGLYGVSCWPTIFSIDANGRIHDIRMGLTEKPPEITKSKVPANTRKE